VKARRVLLNVRRARVRNDKSKDGREVCGTNGRERRTSRREKRKRMLKFMFTFTYG
jgi:hypothetical protein